MGRHAISLYTRLMVYSRFANAPRQTLDYADINADAIEIEH